MTAHGPIILNLKKGVNTFAGKITHANVAGSLKQDYTPLEDLLKDPLDISYV